MGLRVEIQNKIRDLFEGQNFEIVKYNKTTRKAYIDGNETPTVEVNEISNSPVLKLGANTGYVFEGWTFEVILNFNNEIDFSNFILDLDTSKLNFVYNNTIKVENIVSNRISVDHPARQGHHSGSQIKLNINITLRR